MNKNEEELMVNNQIINVGFENHSGFKLRSKNKFYYI